MKRGRNGVDGCWSLTSLAPATQMVLQWLVLSHADSHLSNRFSASGPKPPRICLRALHYREHKDSYGIQSICGCLACLHRRLADFASFNQ